MKKIFIFVLLLSLTSCFSWNNEKENIYWEKINQEPKETKKEQVNEKIADLWQSSKEIVDSYYSNDSKKQEQIKDWLSDEKNERTSEQWDIIEFLDYCENISKLKTTWEIINYILWDNDREDFDKIINSEDFKIYVKNKFNYNKTWKKYKNIDFWLLYSYSKDNKLYYNSLALHSIISILTYYSDGISREQVLEELSFDWKKTYNHFFIEFIQNDYKETFSCKNFLKKNWYHKSIQTND